jgi:hypothetical protein
MSDEEKKEEKEKEFKMPKALEDTLTTLAAGMKTTMDGINALSQRMDKSEEKEKEPEEKKIEYSDLERLGRAEFLDVIVDKMRGIVKEEVGPVGDRVAGVEKSQSTKDVQQQLKEVTEKHKDFWDWKAEIGEKIKTNNLLTAEEAYNLVRIDSPDKAKEMDEKYKADDDKKEVEPKRKDLPFGGLTPTSGKTAESEGMDGADAAEAAWDKVFSGASEVHG